MLVQILPLIFLILLSVLSSLPSLFTDAPPRDPAYSFQSSSHFSLERLTAALEVPYYVHPPEFRAHPIWKSIPEDLRAAKQAGRSSARLYSFEMEVEKTYLYTDCQRATDAKRRKIDDLTGFLGIGADWKEIRKIQAEPITSCQELSRRGLLV